MGDSFFKTFFLAMFAIMGLVGLLMFLRMEKEATDTREQSYYLQSRGKTTIPASWRDKIGTGI